MEQPQGLGQLVVQEPSGQTWFGAVQLVADAGRLENVA
jgi:hypothetical protein